MAGDASKSLDNLKDFGEKWPKFGPAGLKGGILFGWGILFGLAGNPSKSVDNLKYFGEKWPKIGPAGLKGGILFGFGEVSGSGWYLIGGVIP